MKKESGNPDHHLAWMLLGLAWMISSCTAASRESFATTGAVGQTRTMATDTRMVGDTQTGDSRPDSKKLFESLPRDHFNVDWARAVKEGRIHPKGSLNSNGGDEILFDLNVVLQFDDPFIKDVMFSHAVHTYWINCETCHPKLFLPRIAGNRMTMKDIQDGKYCGHCHGLVAFPTHVMPGPHFRDYCLTCHNYGKK